MTHTHIERDERTTAVENAGYRWSYLFLCFGVLLVVAFRSFHDGQASWDLLGLIVLSGALNAGYLGYHRAVYRRGMLLTTAAVIAGALVAAAILLLYRQRV